MKLCRIEVGYIRDDGGFEPAPSLGACTVPSAKNFLSPRGEARTGSFIVLRSSYIHTTYKMRSLKAPTGAQPVSLRVMLRECIKYGQKSSNQMNDTLEPTPPAALTVVRVLSAHADRRRQTSRCSRHRHRPLRGPSAADGAGRRRGRRGWRR